MVCGCAIIIYDHCFNSLNVYNNDKQGGERNVWILIYPFYSSAILPYLDFVIALKMLLVTYLGKMWLKLEKVENNGSYNNFLSVVWASWGIDILATPFSFLLMMLVSFFVPFLSVVHSEWGIVYEKAYVNAAVYMLIALAVYATLLYFIKFAYKPKIADEVKRKRLHILFTVTSVILLAALSILYPSLFELL